MKRTVFLLALLLTVPTITAAQTQTRDRRSSVPESSSTQSAIVRDRVVGLGRAANHVKKPKAVAESKDPAATESSSKANPSSTHPINQDLAEPTWGNTSVIVTSASERIAPKGDSTPPVSRVSDLDVKGVKKPVQQTALIVSAPVAPSAAAAKADSLKSLSRATPPTIAYHVGIGDVLDIRLANLPTRESTLFTVLESGVLEYPLLNGPLTIAGMTTDEIAKLLCNEIKVIETARVSVSVRDYASHAVVISGLVDSPGRKTLRREAMPLFAVLAEALPRSEASVATIVRGGYGQTVSLDDEKAMATLVLPGDVIKISGASSPTTRFVYVGGDVASPGEREFRDGMTLTQALLSAGGISRGSKTSIKVSRRNSGGFLTSNDYNLRWIEEGKSRDPLLEAGDRIEVTRGL
jgi:protein involved in polysaccharide export with SLBB domain